MKRIISLIAVFLSISISGCATEGKFVGGNTDNGCAGGKGTVTIVIRYGDSYLRATNRGNVRRKGEVVFRLKPDPRSDYGIDYSALDVTITGKTPDDLWLNATGKADDSKKPSACVKAAQAFGDYEYFVSIPSVGTLDPRIVVVPDFE